MNDIWNNRFLDLAEYISKWSKDQKKVGCIIVDSNTKKIVATGFNGMPAHFDDKHLIKLDSSIKGIIIEHAEENALNMLSKEDYSKDLWLYTTLPPCIYCSNLIVGSKANITTIIYRDINDSVFYEKYQVQKSLDYLNDNNITIYAQRDF